jgi:hypothetical protein
MSATPAPHSNIPVLKAISNGSGSDQDPNSQDPYGSAPQTDFGNIPRNSFHGPHYADVDLSLYKNLYKTDKAQFKVGAQAFIRSTAWSGVRRLVAVATPSSSTLYANRMLCAV